MLITSSAHVLHQRSSSELYNLKPCTKLLRPPHLQECCMHPLPDLNLLESFLHQARRSGFLPAKAPTFNPFTGQDVYRRPELAAFQMGRTYIGVLTGLAVSDMGKPRYLVL